MTEINDLIKELQGIMVAEGVSQSELARLCGVSRSTVSDFFNRERTNARYTELERYFRVLGYELVVRRV